jgi:hypothetical protein
MYSRDKKFIDKLKTISVHSQPPWMEPLRDLKRTINDGDANASIFEESHRLKKLWTRHGKWARWEKERLAHVKMNKSEWIKRGATPEDRDEATKG